MASGTPGRSTSRRTHCYEPDINSSPNSPNHYDRRRYVPSNHTDPATTESSPRRKNTAGAPPSSYRPRPAYHASHKRNTSGLPPRRTSSASSRTRRSFIGHGIVPSPDYGSRERPENRRASQRSSSSHAQDPYPPQRVDRKRRVSGAPSSRRHSSQRHERVWSGQQLLHDYGSPSKYRDKNGNRRRGAKSGYHDEKCYGNRRKRKKRWWAQWWFCKIPIFLHQLAAKSDIA